MLSRGRNARCCSHWGRNELQKLPGPMRTCMRFEKTVVERSHWQLEGWLRFPESENLHWGTGGYWSTSFADPFCWPHPPLPLSEETWPLTGTGSCLRWACRATGSGLYLSRYLNVKSNHNVHNVTWCSDITIHTFNYRFLKDVTFGCKRRTRNL